VDVESPRGESVPTLPRPRFAQILCLSKSRHDGLNEQVDQRGHTARLDEAWSEPNYLRVFLAMSDSNLRLAAFLIRGASLLFLAASLCCSPLIAGKLDPNPPLDPTTFEAIVTSRFFFLLLAVYGAAVAEILRPSPVATLLRRVFSGKFAAKVLLSLLVVFVPLTTAEIGLRPFTIPRTDRKTTTIFIRDPVLGWRLRPNAEDTWGGVRVKINGKGLRGPEIPYARDANTPRLLFLGDSVTFGYGLAEYRDAYPYQVAEHLERELEKGVETINSGVGGYSPWQQHMFLKNEGLRYRPDIVILGFVLNDVVEKFELTRFGGSSLGHQLSQSYYSVDDWLRHNSSVYAQLMRLKDSLRYGENVRSGALAHQLTSVEDLARFPETDRVRQSWALTLANLEELFALCRKNETPIAVVVFPFRFQIDDPHGFRAPQREIISFCEAQDVPCLDLLPMIAEELSYHNRTPEDLFLDDDHLTARGNQIVAEMIVSWCRSNAAIWSVIVRKATPDHKGSPS